MAKTLPGNVEVLATFYRTFHRQCRQSRPTVSNSIPFDPGRNHKVSHLWRRSVGLQKYIKNLLPTEKRVPWRSVRRCRSRLDKLQFAGGSIVHHTVKYGIENQKQFFFFFFSSPLFENRVHARFRPFSSVRSPLQSSLIQILLFQMFIIHGLVARILMGYSLRFTKTIEVEGISFVIVMFFFGFVQ